MPFHSISKVYDTEDPPNWVGLEIVGLGPTGIVNIVFADLPPGKAAKITYIQELIDVRQPLSELDDGDPNKTVDPALPYYFHAELDGVWYMVSRPVSVTDYVGGNAGFKNQIGEPEI